jgi:hypothetical protein
MTVRGPNCFSIETVAASAKLRLLHPAGEA